MAPKGSILYDLYTLRTSIFFEIPSGAEPVSFVTKRKLRFYFSGHPLVFAYRQHPTNMSIMEPHPVVVWLHFLLISTRNDRFREPLRIECGPKGHGNSIQIIFEGYKTCAGEGCLQRLGPRTRLRFHFVYLFCIFLIEFGTRLGCISLYLCVTFWIRCCDNC